MISTAVWSKVKLKMWFAKKGMIEVLLAIFISAIMSNLDGNFPLRTWGSQTSLRWSCKQGFQYYHITYLSAIVIQAGFFKVHMNKTGFSNKVPVWFFTVFCISISVGMKKLINLQLGALEEYFSMHQIDIRNRPKCDSTKGQLQLNQFKCPCKAQVNNYL